MFVLHAYVQVRLRELNRKVEIKGEPIGSLFFFFNLASAKQNICDD